jgi:hypothetical protein
MKQPTCTVCHRPLSDPYSVAVGMGPECRGGASRRGIRFPKAKYRVHHGRVEFTGVEGFEGPLGGVLPPLSKRKELDIMMTGMYWQSNKPLEKSLPEAIAYYRKKYGQEPTTARVNPSVLSHEVVMQGVTIKPMREVPLLILWLGVEDAARGVEQASADLLRRAEG